MDGFLIINKPTDWTSHDVVAKLRAHTGIRKIGHTGTLDPFATGVLVVGLGKATKLFEYLTGATKEYVTTFCFGATSDTDDRTGKITPRHNASRVPLVELTRAIQKFTGRIEQRPPQYSAVKIRGRKMYELARQGKFTEAQPRSVEVLEFTILKYRYPHLKVHLKVSSGTYIRALARDLGETLGCGAYVKKLERTAVGPWPIKEAVKLKRLLRGTGWRHRVQPVEAGLFALPKIEVTPAEVNTLRLGKKIDLARGLNKSSVSRNCAVLDQAGKLVALVEKQNNSLSPRKVF